MPPSFCTPPLLLAIRCQCLVLSLVNPPHGMFLMPVVHPILDYVAGRRGDFVLSLTLGLQAGEP